MFLKVLENEARESEANASRRAGVDNRHLEVRMFNVSHGEAVLIVFDQKRAWLVDSGINSRPRNKLLGQRLIDYLEERHLILEAIVASHPHFDHGGAFETILGSHSPNIASPLTIYRSDDASWDSTKGWRNRFRDAVTERQGREEVVEITLKDSHREVNISHGVEAHLFAGSGDGPYTSLFMQLRYHDARLLFTGDAHCSYEIELLERFGEEDFRADVLKVTHHGSSSGTARSMVEAVRPGIAIVSTGDDPGHRLERDTLDRLRGHPIPGGQRSRRVFETLVAGDIILRTDGESQQDGRLYEVAFESPGRFAQDLDAKVLPLARVDADRTRSHNSACE